MRAMRLVSQSVLGEAALTTKATKDTANQTDIVSFVAL